MNVSTLKKPGRWIVAQPVGVLLAGLLITLFVWHGSRQAQQAREVAAFNHLVDRLSLALSGQLEANEQILRSVAGLFDSSDDVTRQEFKRFVAAQHVEQRFPGIQGIGFSQLVRAESLAKHLRSVQADGFPKYAIRPAGERDPYSSIVYLEPFDWRNQRAFGYDMFSEPVRRKAMERARDTGKAALSGKVTLVQETTTDVQAGFLLYVPVYLQHENPTPDTLIGWAYSPIRMNDMMRSLIGSSFPQMPALMSIAIHDGDSDHADSLLYRSATATPSADALTVRRHQTLAGHGWTLVVQSQPEFHALQSQSIPQLILGGGLAITVLLTLLAALGARNHTRALQQIADLDAANQALDASKHLLQSIYDTSNAAIFVVDMRGVITHANASMVSMFGCPMGQLVGSEYVSHIHPEERAASRENMIALMATQIPSVSLDRLYWREDGSQFWGHLSGRRLLDVKGETYGLVGVITDINDYKIATAELQQHRDNLQAMVDEKTEALIRSNADLTRAKNAAESANRAKDAFLANMSHELRTPLNAICGMTYLVKHSLQDPEQLARLAKVDAAAHHLTGIINDVLEISKVDAGKIRIVSERLQIPAVVDAVVAMISRQAEKKGLQIIVEIEALPQTLLGDAQRLRQALINFGNNAVKFTNAGSVRIHVYAIEETNADVLVRFDVSDTGIGIEPETLPRLFAPFEQADNSMTRKYGGTGLGLAITKRLAELMDGETGVTSQPGIGSTFWFTARLTKPAVLADPATTAENAEEILTLRHGNRRILLIEDDPASRDFVHDLLQRAAIDVDLADSGEAGLEQIAKTPYALILMDLSMPGIDGLEATRLLRALPNGSQVPVIALTANAFEKDRAACLAAGMNDFLTKPVSPDTLFVTLLKWMQ